MNLEDMNVWLSEYNYWRIEFFPDILFLFLSFFSILGDALV